MEGIGCDAIEEMPLNSYKDLIVWQKSMLLVTEVYRITKSFPPEEVFGLSSQMRRSAVPIPSNIAEGYGRKSVKEYSQFYSIAYSSVLELETQMMMAQNLKYISKQEFDLLSKLISEVARLIYVINEKLKTKR